MVATRNHPVDFEEPQTSSPQPTSSPRKRATRTSNANHASPTKSSSPPPTPTKSRSSRASTRKSEAWSHTPSNLTLIWLAISLPLVVYDTSYVLLRPHSMPGGKLYSVWKPYGWYGEVDRYYGFKAFNAGSGWTGAQSWFNVIETLGYMVYLYLVYTYGEQEDKQGAGAPDKSVMGALSESRTVYGKIGTYALFIAYSAASLTFWKTVLYWLNEALSGWDMIGHNTWYNIIVYWVGLNGPWIVVPGYLSYVFGKEILEGLEFAASPESR